MSDIRTVNLDELPEGQVEVRVQKGNCKVSIWLPADAADVAAAMYQLGQAGFEFQEKEEVKR